MTTTVKNWTHPILVKKSYLYLGKPARINIKKNKLKISFTVVIIEKLNFKERKKK